MDPALVPAWVGAAGTIAQVLVPLVGRRQERVVNWVRDLDGLVGEIARDEVARRVADNPALEELVLTALETASRTVGDRKRHALAKAVAAALRGDVGRIDEQQLLVRTIEALDEAHVQVLSRLAAHVASRRGPRGKQLNQIEQVGTADIEGMWSGTPDLAEPLIAALEAQGLLKFVDVGDRRAISGPLDQLEDYRRWKVTPFGLRLLAFLAE